MRDIYNIDTREAFMAWEYSRMRGYPILNTPELLWNEIAEVAKHYAAIKEAVEEKDFQYEYRKWLTKNLRLWEGRTWFPLSILGLMMSAEFIESQLEKMIAYGAILEVDFRARVVCVGLALLLHLESFPEDSMHRGSKESIRDQKERLAVLISTLWKDGTIDPRLSDMIAVTGSDEPGFFLTFFNAYSQALAATSLSLEKKPLH